MKQAAILFFIYTRSALSAYTVLSSASGKAVDKLPHDSTLLSPDVFMLLFNLKWVIISVISAILFFSRSYHKLRCLLWTPVYMNTNYESRDINSIPLGNNSASLTHFQ